ncbi:helix-turn-helix transcriptional regulator [Peribacillus tepidiphilus]|uniref:helix-turn-helix transcriptional regulator n=1 Tax=Peribacillus tepidiphilus TaxID=2652445 RepID=UPI001291D639|nr:helix-turn-helix transcriptional regulator [Peribacillus tepidiphilus]
MVENYYTVEEVANLLKLSKYTVYEMVKRGELSAVKVGRQVRISRDDINRMIDKGKRQHSPDDFSKSVLPIPIMFIGSHDLLVESVINYANEKKNGLLIIPAFVGSMEGLLSLYYGRADIVGCHLFDEETGTYNIPFIKRLFPGETPVVVRFVSRNIGWIVPKGNPKRLEGWNDLLRNDLTFMNRQKGSGTRILLDFHLKKLGVDGSQIKGYEKEEMTHYSAASAVSRGEVDFALGTESAAQALGLDFVVLEKERYDLVMKKDFYASHQWKNLESLLLSDEIKERMSKLGGYEWIHIGEKVTEGL